MESVLTDFGNAKHLVVIDHEATTSNDRTVPAKEMETIEIGAVLVRADSYDVVDEFQTFVRPVLHPEQTPFCMELTGISQEMVDSGPLFPRAVDALRNQLPINQPDLIWGSWGQFDETPILQDCAFHDLPYFLPKHFNLKKMFSGQSGDRTPLWDEGCVEDVWCHP